MLSLWLLNFKGVGSQEWVELLAHGYYIGYVEMLSFNCEITSSLALEVFNLTKQVADNFLFSEVPILEIGKLMKGHRVQRQLYGSWYRLQNSIED